MSLLSKVNTSPIYGSYFFRLMIDLLVGISIVAILNTAPSNASASLLSQCVQAAKTKPQKENELKICVEAGQAHWLDSKNRSLAYAWLSNGMIKLQQWEKALDAAQSALRYNPENTGALNNAGVSLRVLGRYQESLRAFNNALRIKPNYSLARIQKGWTLSSLYAASDFLAHSKRFVVDEPNNSRAHYMLSVAYTYNGNVKASIESARRSIELDPNSYRPHTILSGGFRELGEFDSALMEANTAINLNEQSIWGHFAKARVFVHLGNKTGALDSMNRALRISKTSNVIRTAASIHLGLGSFEEGQSKAREAARMTPECGRCRYTLAYALGLTGNWDEALDEAEEGVRLNPESGFAHAILGRTLVYLGCTKEGGEALEKGIKLAPYPFNYLLVGEVANAMGDFEISLRAFEKALEMAPNLINSQHHYISSVASSALKMSREHRSRVPSIAKPPPSTRPVAQATQPAPQLQVQSPQAHPTAANLNFGRYHALVIGNNDYANLTKLRSAVNDAWSVAQVLEADYGFNVRLLTNATRSHVIDALADVRADLGPNDNLLIYYAGHGVLDSYAEEGYWLPVDAKEGSPSNWISNGNLTNMIRAIRAKHVLVVADSCYSGTLVRAAPVKIRTAREYDAWLARMAKKRSRTALVSGGLEPVIDSGGGTHSVFAKAFLNALRENPDVLDGHALFTSIRRPVALESDQTPQYSDIRRSGHDGGEFLFVRTAAPVSQRPVSQTLPTPKPASGDHAAEIAFWNSIKDSKDPEEYQAFLEQFPKGIFARLARKRMKAQADAE